MIPSLGRITSVLFLVKHLKGSTFFARLAWFLPKEALLCYYNTYILPHFTYADMVRNTCTAAESARLECLQNFAVRLILQCHWGASAISMRKDLGWPTLSSKGKLSEVVTAFHCISGHSPSYLSSLLRPVVSLHSHGTRSASSNGLHLPKSRLAFEEELCLPGSSKLEFTASRVKANPTP